MWMAAPGAASRSASSGQPRSGPAGGADARTHVRYATPGGFREAALAAGVRGEALGCAETTLRARLHMYAPGQPMARELAKNPTVLMVNDTLFAHGGVLPHHGAPHRRAAPCAPTLRLPPLQWRSASLSLGRRPGCLLRVPSVALHIVGAQCARCAAPCSAARAATGELARDAEGSPAVPPQ